MPSSGLASPMINSHAACNWGWMWMQTRNATSAVASPCSSRVWWSFSSIFCSKVSAFTKILSLEPRFGGSFFRIISCTSEPSADFGAVTFNSSPFIGWIHRSICFCMMRSIFSWLSGTPEELHTPVTSRHEMCVHGKPRSMTHLHTLSQIERDWNWELAVMLKPSNKHFWTRLPNLQGKPLSGSIRRTGCCCSDFSGVLVRGRGWSVAVLVP